ncbi:MAG: hypothetical protein SCL54_15640 [Bacillota bacterium]|nr:hypothetical protein [Bacillota bacterium]
MKWSVHEILRKRKCGNFSVADSKDFELGVDNVSDGEVFSIKGFSPYCFDYDSDHFIFVDVSAGDSESPFLYLDQYERSTKVLVVDRCFLSDYFNFDEERIKESAGPLFVFSIGRCGSTLLGRLLKSFGFFELSEPDILTGIDFRRDDFRVKQIAYLSFLSFCFDSGKKLGDVAVKFRSGSLYSTRVYANLFPGSRFIFLKRNILDWSRSFVDRFNFDANMLISTLRAGWFSVSCMRKNGLNYLVVNFEDLLNNPENVLSPIISVFESSRLDNDMLDLALSKNSQKGTGLDKPISVSLEDSRVSEFLSELDKVKDKEMRKFYHL